MRTDQQEQLRLLNNVEETHNLDYSEELIKRDRIKGTPFTMVEDKEKGWYMVMGNYIITSPTKERYETLDKLINEQYNIMLSMIIIVLNKQMET